MEQLVLPALNGHVVHLQVGTDEWQPTAAEMEQLTTLLNEALADPHGAVIATPVGVVATVLTTGGASVPATGGILHLQVGSPNWEPTEDELQAIALLFGGKPAENEPE